MQLTELRCITQSEGGGGSEPYLWVTYFAHGVDPLPGRSGPVATNTPAYDAFRTEFPDGVRAGQAVPVPPFLATGSFDIDLDRTYKQVGCIAVLMEEDVTPQSSIILGRIAYAKEIENQLNLLATKRVQTGDAGPITDDELSAIRKAVTAKAEAAIGSNQSIWDFFRNQDDPGGFTYVAYGDEGLKELAESASRTKSMAFKEISNESGSDRYALSGIVSIAAPPGERIDLCATERAAVNAKEQQINWLQARRDMLQVELQHAAPQSKAAIVDEITATTEAITLAEQELAPLKAALDACTIRRGGAGRTGHDTNVVRDQPR
jgi:hypothetical protein